MTRPALARRIGAVVLCGVLAGCRPAGGPPPPAVAVPAPPATAPTALALVHDLGVRGRGPRTGYAREAFGPAWADTDRNGCDTRNDVLRRDLTGVTVRSGTRDCVVLAGELAEPYGGRSLAFRKQAAGDVQIDHVVSLSDSWRKGAASWPAEQRLRFANDPLNLLAVDGALNQQKSDADAASWLPPNRAYRCRFIARQVAVKHTYRLGVTAAEREAMVRVLRTCPQEPAPGG